VIPLFLALLSATPDYNVFSYDVDLEIDRDQKQISGHERLRVRSLVPGLTSLAFPRNGIRIRSVRSPSGAELGHTEANDRIEIRLPAPLRRGGEASLEVEYETTAPKGVVFHDDAIYTAFDTCHWMVCRERPDDKATLALALTAADGLTVVASGAPVSTTSAGAGRTRHAWKESVPSSPYLFGFAIGNFQRTVRVHRGTRLEYYAAGLDGDRLKQAFADDDRMLDFFVEKAGRPLPRPFYRQVVVNGGAAQEMSSFSVLGREHVDARLAQPSEDWFIAHEMAHQFWGNAVTCADWSHFWLNEGITVFMVAAYKEQRWGRAAYDHEMDLARTRRQAAADAHMDVPLAFAGEYPSLKIKRAVTYSKAALFLDRLRAAMGDRAFWRGLRSYTRRHAGGVATSQDFQRALAAATTKDLSALFDEWVYGRGNLDARNPR
jgi:aminopeptidase N